MGIRDLFRRRTATALTPEEVEEMRETARAWIATGFRERTDLAVELADFHDEFEASGKVVLAAAEQVVATEWQRRLDEEAAWSTPSDYDRLEAAFSGLADQGVVARMNFTCCQNCGTTEIADERTPGDTASWYPYREWGYTFFHQQDAERLAEADPILFLSYSGFRSAPGLDEDLLDRARTDDEEAQAEVVRQTDETVGRLVVAALTDAGLTVDWDGDSSTRIAVTGLDWRKPLPR